MDALRKMYKQYFKYLHDHVSRCNSFIASANNYLSAMSNLTEHLVVVTSAKLGNEMLQLFPDIRNRLIAKLHLLIEDELIQIQKIQENMNDSNRDLRMRLSQLEHCYRTTTVAESDIQSGDDESSEKNEFDPLWPPFGELSEMASDAWSYYHDLWLNIKTSILCINFEDSKTIANLRNAFREDSEKKRHVDSILAMTRFFVDQA